VSDGSRAKQRSKTAARKGAASDDAAPFLRQAAEWKGYVNIEQSAESKAQFEAFADDADLVSEVSAEILLRGYKISVVQVDDDETVKASAFAAFRGMPDAGYSVSAWAPTLLSAVAAVTFIVALQAQFDLSQYASDVSGKRRRTF